MNLLRRLFAREPYNPEVDERAKKLDDATQRLQQQAEEVREYRLNGNFLADRLTLPKPAMRHPDAEGVSGGEA